MATFFKTLLIASAATLISSSLIAENATQTPAPENTAPLESKAAEPLGAVTLAFPSELRIYGNEGWVELNYIVDKEGNVKDPIVEASVGNPVFEQSAIEALKSVKYSPAMYKGSAVTQSISGEVIEFLLDQTFEGVDQGFSTAYADLISLYQQNNYTDGDIGLEKLSISQDLTIQELSLLEVLRSYSAAQRDKPLLQLQHLRNASVLDGMYLPKEILITVLQARFVLAAKYSLFQEAFASYNFLEQIDPLNDKLTTLALMVAPMQKAIEAGQLIKVDGVIGSRGHWAYIPMRRSYAFQVAEQGVKEIEPRCERRNQRFPVNTESEWTIPVSWGECSIVIYGTPGAKFELLEYADEAG